MCSRRTMVTVTACQHRCTDDQIRAGIDRQRTSLDTQTDIQSTSTSTLLLVIQCYSLYSRRNASSLSSIHHYHQQHTQATAHTRTSARTHTHTHTLAHRLAQPRPTTASSVVSDTANTADQTAEEPACLFCLTASQPAVCTQ